MKTRRSWRNQNRMWKLQGGVVKQAKQRPRNRTLKPARRDLTLWGRYCALFDAGRYAEALPFYAEHLKQQALKTEL